MQIVIIVLYLLLKDLSEYMSSVSSGFLTPDELYLFIIFVLWGFFTFLMVYLKNQQKTSDPSGFLLILLVSFVVLKYFKTQFEIPPLESLGFYSFIGFIITGFVSFFSQKVGLIIRLKALIAPFITRLLLQGLFVEDLIISGKYKSSTFFILGLSLGALLIVFPDLWLVLDGLFVIYIQTRTTVLSESNLNKLSFSFEDSYSCGNISLLSLNLLLSKQYNIRGPKGFLDNGRDIRFFYIPLPGSNLSKRGMLTNVKVNGRKLAFASFLTIVGGAVSYLGNKSDDSVSRCIERYSNDCESAMARVDGYIQEAEHSPYTNKDGVKSVLLKERSNLGSFKKKLDDLNNKPVYRLIFNVSTAFDFIDGCKANCREAMSEIYRNTPSTSQKGSTFSCQISELEIKNAHLASKLAKLEESDALKKKQIEKLLLEIKNSKSSKK